MVEVGFKYEKYMKHSLGRKRETMPQINKNQLDEILLHYQGKSPDAKVSKVKLKLSKLKPAQAEMNDEKILGMMSGIADGTFNISDGFVISKDNYLVDGHHTWATGLEQDEDQEVTCYKISLPIKELLRRTNLMKIASKVDIDDKDIQKAVNEYITDSLCYLFNEYDILLKGPSIGHGEPITIVHWKTGKNMTGVWRTMPNDEKAFVSASGTVLAGIGVDTPPVEASEKSKPKKKEYNKEKPAKQEISMHEYSFLEGVVDPADWAYNAKTGKMKYVGDMTQKELDGLKSKEHVTSMEKNILINKNLAKDSDFHWTGEHGKEWKNKSMDDLVDHWKKELGIKPDKAPKVEKEKQQTVSKDHEKEAEKFWTDFFAEDKKKAAEKKKKLDEEFEIMVAKAAAEKAEKEKLKKIQEKNALLELEKKKAEEEEAKKYDEYGFKPVEGMTLGGSTGAQLVQDKMGNKFVKKKGGGPNPSGHIENEYWTNKLYNHIQYFGSFTTKDGLPNVAQGTLKLYGDEKALYNRYIPSAIPLKDLSGTKKEAALNQLKDTFVIDALLGNWDVIGMSKDNVVFDPYTDRIVKIDNAGSMTFRAQGGSKSFGEEVNEINTMRDPSINPQAAEIFGSLTDEDIIEQVAALPEKLNHEMSDLPNGAYDVINKRIAWLKEKYKKEIKAPIQIKKIFVENSKFYSPDVKKFYKSLNKKITIEKKDLEWAKDYNGEHSWMVNDSAAKKHLKDYISNKNSYHEKLLDAGLTPQEIIAIADYTGGSSASYNKAISAVVGTDMYSSVGIKAKDIDIYQTEHFSNNYSKDFYNTLVAGAKTVNHHLSDGDYNFQKIDAVKKLKAQMDSLEKKGLAPEKKYEKEMFDHYKKLAENIINSHKNKKKTQMVSEFKLTPTQEKEVVAKTDDSIKDVFKFETHSPKDMSEFSENEKKNYLLKSKLAISGLAKAKKAKITSKRTVFRKISSSSITDMKAFIGMHSVGSEVMYPRFNSTSKKASTWNGDIKMTIKTKSGLDVQNISQYYSESEVLIGPFQRFKVTKSELGPYGGEVHLEEI